MTASTSRTSRPLAPDLVARFHAVRAATEALAEPLSPEDCALQSMESCSPVKWHLAHTSWFFETFLLAEHLPGYVPPRPEYRVLFNSYYRQVGERWPRPERGLLSRPSLDEVRAYRRHVDGAMAELLGSSRGRAPAVAARVELGLQHEQQHQELILTDVLHLFSRNPSKPVYRPARGSPRGASASAAAPLRWIAFDGGVREIGASGYGFAFDIEASRHRVLLAPFELAARLVTNREWLAFVDDGGYRRSELWLAEGLDAAQAQGWTAPLHWERGADGGRQFTLAGLVPLELDAPVCHVSFFEADAFARWAGARLPTEAEWEVAAAGAPVAGNFVESGELVPRPAAVTDSGAPAQLFGDVWEWTASPYVAYPGYRAPDGAIGEYNGKFMVNQLVLRGGSCVSPRDHLRASYRNFFHAHERWQFMGLRLARDAR